MSNTQNPLVALKLSGIKAQFIVDLMADETDAKEAEDKASALEAHCKANGLKNGETVLESIKTDQKAFADGAKLNSGEVITLRKMLEKVAKPAEESPKTQVSSGAAPAQQPTTPPQPQVVPQIDLLPKLATDDDFLRLLLTGGTLKVDEITVQAGLRAAIDEQMGVFMIPDRLQARMRELTDQADEPHTEDFYKIDELLSKRTHGPVFKALGISASYYTESAKRQLLGSIRTDLFAALHDFYQQIMSWKDQVVAETSLNGGIGMMAFFNPGAAGTMMALQNPPSIAPLQEAAKNVVAKINRAFRGHGIPVSRALANEALEIQKLIEPSNAIHTKLNFANRDQMLGYLGFTSVQDLLRSRNYLVGFALGVLKLGEIPDGQTGLMYVGQLMNRGGNVTWNSLGVANAYASSRPAANAGRRNDSYDRSERNNEFAAPRR